LHKDISLPIFLVKNREKKKSRVQNLVLQVLGMPMLMLNTRCYGANIELQVIKFWMRRFVLSEKVSLMNCLHWGCIWYCNFVDKKCDFKPNHRKWIVWDCVLKKKKLRFKNTEQLHFQITSNMMLFFFFFKRTVLNVELHF
jgi:hypothetical protein